MELSREAIAQIQTVEQQSQEVEQNLEFVVRQIMDLEQFMDALKAFSKSNEKEMLSPLGKGVYVKTQILDKKLYVDAGANVTIRKTPEEAGKIVEGQLSNLKKLKVQLTNQLELYSQAMQQLLREIEASAN
jgi:prefoldin alpha subunit